jgi:hypothetical protein
VPVLTRHPASREASPSYLRLCLPVKKYVVPLPGNEFVTEPHRLFTCKPLLALFARVRDGAGRGSARDASPNPIRQRVPRLLARHPLCNFKAIPISTGSGHIDEYFVGSRLELERACERGFFADRPA